VIEDKFDIPFAARLSQREKQIQQRYRPIIGVHKWFARRPGALFRSLLLSEFAEGGETLVKKYFRSNDLSGRTVGDPFMGGGTPLFEANRLGCNVVGADINPMSYWVVKQELADIDLGKFRETADEVVTSVEDKVGDLYQTTCNRCGDPAGIKYFLWVKVIDCVECGDRIHLFRNYRVAKNERHPNYVILCSHCHELNEVESEDELEDTPCSNCGESLQYDGPARRKYSSCPSCGAKNSAQPENGTPEHHLYAVEYNCSDCYSDVDGRQFKAPDEEDRRRVEEAKERFEAFGDQYVPDDEIPEGDESDRLLRWGYEKYREVFNSRQLYGLSVLKQEIEKVEKQEIREALITVFSDFLRYQNMVCRYDNWALKIQDIFSVHGFPVSLEQCENSLLGIPNAGSGGYRHFLKKYERAKEYCEHPFECTSDKKEKHTEGEHIRANFVDRPQDLVNVPSRSASLHSEDSADLNLDGVELDGVFTDPPYFANVQYAELIDFCYVWIKDLINGEVGSRDRTTTRRTDELTVNETEDRGVIEFTEGLSHAYSNFASALKPSAPFVFTYHHNEFEAYIPVVVAILDADLVCTSTLACPAEMGASVHISGTSSSVVDSVFVCRGTGRINPQAFELTREAVENALLDDLSGLKAGGLRPSMGDARCILLGHIARLLIWHLRGDWDSSLATKQKIDRIREKVGDVFPSRFVENLTGQALDSLESFDEQGTLFGDGISARQEKSRTIEFV